MKIKIELSKRNRKTLLRLSKRLFPDFKFIKIRKRTICLKRRWYSLGKERMHVVDLVLLHIPQAINELYEENDLCPIFTFPSDLESAVEYFGLRTMNGDIIQFLQYHVDNMDMSLNLVNNLEPVPVRLTERETVKVKETFVTQNVVEESIEYFYDIMTSVIDVIRNRLEVVHVRTESACNSPPIRGPSIALSA